MAASHLAALEETVAERVLAWATVEELDRVIERIP